MRQSEQLDELNAALAAAQAQFGAIPKDSDNKFFSSKYASLASAVKNATPIIAKHGLSVSQFPGLDEHGDILTTWLLHKSGQFICESMRLHSAPGKGQSVAQGLGSAVTYARRYAYMSVLGLVADEDTDGQDQPPASEPQFASQSDVEEMLAAAKGLAGSQVAAALAEVGLADVKAYNKIPHDKVVELIVAFGKRQSEQLLPLDPVAPDPDMSTDVGQPITVVSPRTSEVLALDSPTVDLGGYLADVREHESMLREAKNLVSAELLRRMDTDATWTIHAGGLKLTGSSPAPAEEFDELALRESLWQLVDEGVITVEAADKAVETVVTYKARKAGINALRKLGGRVAETVNQHATSVEKTRYVKVEQA